LTRFGVRLNHGTEPRAQGNAETLSVEPFPCFASRNEMPITQHGHFQGPICTGPQGQRVFIYYAPGSSSPQYVAFMPDGRSYFSDPCGQPVSSDVTAPSVAILGGIIGAAFGGGVGALVGVIAGALAAKYLPTSARV